MLAALDEPAQRLTPGMFLPGMPGRAREQAAIPVRSDGGIVAAA
jgi:hypothetical protein